MEQCNRCGTCEFFTGIGDWGLSCKNPTKERAGWYGVLVYDSTPACINYKERNEDSNVSINT